jgi:hypothetical protein
MEDKIKALAKVIEREISYDASGHSDEERCPHCHKVIKEEQTWGYWIDNKGTLAQAIVNHLGLGSGLRGAIEEKLGDVYVTGDKKKDSVEIAEAILT